MTDIYVSKNDQWLIAPPLFSSFSAILGFYVIYMFFGIFERSQLFGQSRFFGSNQPFDGLPIRWTNIVTVFKHCLARLRIQSES